MPHRVDLFLIRRHEDGQRRRGVRVEAALNLIYVGGDVACAALEVAEARQLVDHAAVDQPAEDEREQRQADDLEQGARLKLQHQGGGQVPHRDRPGDQSQTETQARDARLAAIIQYPVMPDTWACVPVCPAGVGTIRLRRYGWHRTM